MSVFHRIDDVSQMTSARYFKLAERIPAYQGVTRIRVMADLEKLQAEQDNADAAEAMAKKYGPNTPVQPGDNTFAQALFDPEMVAKAREMATIARKE